jgi:hypothetical protein
MATTHELALAASINLENALMGFDGWNNIALAMDALQEIAHAAS